MNKIDSNKIGFVLGGMFAFLHLVWVEMVWFKIAKPFLDWIFRLHFLEFQYTISTFSFGKALMLIIVAGLFGYILGFVFGWLWNFVHHSAHNK